VLSGAKTLIEALKREKVKVIFGLPGGAIMPVYDELLDSDIRHILVTHEQCAGHMADSFARVSRRVGVCMTTSGPGSTNLVTGIATAHMDSSPVVAITGQVASPLIGKDAFQEVDTPGVTAAVTKYTFQVRHQNEIPLAVRTGFYIASAGRPGPVIIDLPRDVQVGEAEVSFTDRIAHTYRNPERFSEAIVKSATKVLDRAERLLIIAGGGIKSCDASRELKEISQRLRAPVVNTLMAKGCISETHPLAMGMIGMHGLPYANRLMREADVILAIGCRFSDRTVGVKGGYLGEAKIVHVDIDASEIGKNVVADVQVVGDAKAVMRHLLHVIKPSRKRDGWLKYAAELKRSYRSPPDQGIGLKPIRLMKELRQILPRNGIVTTEVGQNQMWAALYFRVYSPRTFVSSGGLGTMGFGFPAALGAKVAKPDSIVVDIAGDGSFLMTQQELATSVRENIPVVVIIMNNQMLGMVAQWQRALYNRRYSQTKLGRNTDFVKLAEAYGAQGLRAESYEEFRKAVKIAFRSDVTTVIDVPISPEEDVLPISLPTR
jgi:acetolactate synthase-1/2/3 large subunit